MLGDLGHLKGDAPQDDTRASFASLAHGGDGCEVRHVGSRGTTIVRVRQANVEAAQPAMPEFTLSVLLAGRSRPWRDLGDGYRVPSGAEQFNHLGAGILTPHDTAANWRVEGMHDCLIFAFPFGPTHRALEELLPDGAHSLYQLTDRVVSCSLLPAISHQLWEQAEDRIGALFSDHALALLLAQLAREATSRCPGGAGPSAAKERLAPHALRRAKEFLEANLAGDPSLEAVAAAAGLSPYHFLRSFKATTGRTPFQWLQDRRIQQAATLLASTDAPLVDVALEVGFKNQSHFTVVFRRLVGSTPARWRKDKRR